jgi:hypothetical protein
VKSDIVKMVNDMENRRMIKNINKPKFNREMPYINNSVGLKEDSENLVLYRYSL